MESAPEKVIKAKRNVTVGANPDILDPSIKPQTTPVGVNRGINRSRAALNRTNQEWNIVSGI